MHQTTWKHPPRRQQRSPAEPSRAEPLATVAPRPAAPLPSPPPAANAVPECPWRTTPPPHSDATTPPPPVEMLMPANPSPSSAHTFPCRSPCPGAGAQLLRSGPARRCPATFGARPAGSASSRPTLLPGGAAARPSGGESRCRRPAAARPCPASKGKRAGERRGAAREEEEANRQAGAGLARLFNGSAPRAWRGRNMADRHSRRLSRSPPRAAVRRGRAAGRAAPPLPPPRDAAPRLPLPPRPGPAPQGRPPPPALRRRRRARGGQGRWGEESGRFLTPNGCEERSPLRFVLPGTAFPSARRRVWFRFPCF